MRLKDGKEIVRNLPLLALLLLTATLIFSRCANQGMPTGGPKDTIPPLLTDMTPPLRGLNYTGKDVRITFNEYIVPDAVSEELVISPPLEKRPVIRTKSKTLIVGFNEELKPDVTYSLDFKNSVTNKNENNP
ncbi:MAG TPA: Ig-like domain-containing protein, partial [Prolixibacteraceae bacterium]|nr:Ig-like domain-containing protein [Prolixibacteraceae bacterium]